MDNIRLALILLTYSGLLNLHKIFDIISGPLHERPRLRLRAQTNLCCNSKLMSWSLLDKKLVYINTLFSVVLFSFSLDKILAAMTIAAERNNKERFAPIVEGLENHEAQQLQVSVLPFPRNIESESCTSHLPLHLITACYNSLHSLFQTKFSQIPFVCSDRMKIQQHFNVSFCFVLNLISSKVIHLVLN